jgi:hypothetical protein
LAFLLPACQAAIPSPTLAPDLSTPSPVPSLLSTSAPTLVGAQALVQVDPECSLQTLQTVRGGNFIHYFAQTGTPLDPVSTYNLDHLPMKQTRIRMSLESWEPQNDDSDPKHFEWQAFQDTEYNRNTFLFMQELQKRGIEIIAA